MSLVMALSLALYSAALRLTTPLWLARLWWRGRAEPLYRHAMRERLGFGRGAGTSVAPDARPVWIHAVSLGETHAASALIAELRRQHPGLRLLLTHGTATGRAAGANLLREGDTQAWLPIDTPGATRRFLAKHQPRVGILMETEVWPNLIDQARRAGIPMVLANARLSERSLAKGLRWRSLMVPAVRQLSLVLAQTDDDARRLRQMGAGDVQVCGNLKYDVAPDPELLARGRAWRKALGRPVVLAASTREGEEAMLLEAWRRQWRPPAGAGLPADGASMIRPLLVIVPRHPQRFIEVHSLIAASGMSVLRRSAWPANSLEPMPKDLDVLLGDSMGEMPMYYGMADAALLGGSFGPFGGQNLIEAAKCDCPIWMGPHIFNFSEAGRLAIAAGAAFLSPTIDLALRDIGEFFEATAERSEKTRVENLIPAFFGADVLIGRALLPLFLKDSRIVDPLLEVA
jgi:3-deoxy-D-manno-octulosonic-acid transferase